MSKIVRGMNISCLEFLEPHLMPNVDTSSKEQFLSELQMLFTRAPDTLFVLMVIDGKTRESFEMKAFLIAWAPPGYNFVLVCQAWSQPDTERELVDKCFLRLTQWTSSINRNQLRMETHRDADAWNRRWGFHAISHTMALDINDAFEEKLIKAIHNKEVTNGTVGTEVNQHVNTGAERHLEYAGELFQGTLQPRGDTLSGLVSPDVADATVAERVGDAEAGDGNVSEQGHAVSTALDADSRAAGSDELVQQERERPDDADVQAGHSASDQ